jgi:predicted small secreted protein
MKTFLSVLLCALMLWSCNKDESMEGVSYT